VRGSSWNLLLELAVGTCSWNLLLELAVPYIIPFVKGWGDVSWTLFEANVGGGAGVGGDEGGGGGGTFYIMELIIVVQERLVLVG
jgi:hypothetical protein